MNRARVLITAALAALLATLAASTALATVHVNPHLFRNAAGTFTATPTVTFEFRVWDTAHTSQLSLTCTGVTYSGTKPANGSAGVLPVHIAPTSCTFLGTPTSFTPGPYCGPTGTWQFFIKDYNDATGLSNGAGLSDCDMNFSVSGFCTISVGAASAYSPTLPTSLLRDRNATNTAAATHVNAGGMEVVVNSIWFPYTSTCGNVDSNDTGYVSMGFFVPGVWVGP